MSRKSFFNEDRQDTVRLLGSTTATYNWVYPSCCQSKYLQPLIACLCVYAAVHLRRYLCLSIMYCCLSSVSACIILPSGAVCLPSCSPLQQNNRLMQDLCLNAVSFQLSNNKVQNVICYSDDMSASAHILFHFFFQVCCMNKFAVVILPVESSIKKKSKPWVVCFYHCINSIGITMHMSRCLPKDNEAFGVTRSQPCKLWQN